MTPVSTPDLIQHHVVHIKKAQGFDISASDAISDPGMWYHAGHAKLRIILDHVCDSCHNLVHARCTGQLTTRAKLETHDYNRLTLFRYIKLSFNSYFTRLASLNGSCMWRCQLLLAMNIIHIVSRCFYLFGSNFSKLLPFCLYTPSLFVPNQIMPS